jgi:hypothetical protein
VARPRILLVPQLTELEWLIKPLLEEWADVASYDAPGVGEEPSSEKATSEAVAERGLEELARRGWDCAVIVADDAAEAVALGHARLSNSIEGERPALNREIYAALTQLSRHDPRTFIRQMFKMTQGEQLKGGYGEDLAESYMERVPTERVLDFYATRPEAGRLIADPLRGLDVPILLAQHKGCLLFTGEGFEDAVAAFPAAQVVMADEKPSASADFARALHSFCREHVFAV